MPKGVVKTKKQEDIWNYKKKQVEKQTGKKSSQFSADEWRRVNFLYQKAKKKYKGKLPKKYLEAEFKEIVAANYRIIIADSTELSQLQSALKATEQKINLLCEGFNVQLEPSYDKIIDKVVKKVDHWESTDKIAEDQDRIPFIVYHQGKQYTLAGNEISPSIFKQFHDKFLEIVKTSILPAIKAYVKKNPTIKVKVFRPLLDVAIKR